MGLVYNKCVPLLTCWRLLLYFFPSLFCAYFLIEEKELFSQDINGGLLKGRRCVCENTAERVLEEKKGGNGRRLLGKEKSHDCICCFKASFINRLCHRGVFFGGI